MRRRSPLAKARYYIIIPALTSTRRVARDLSLSLSSLSACKTGEKRTREKDRKNGEMEVAWVAGACLED